MPETVRSLVFDLVESLVESSANPAPLLTVLSLLVSASLARTFHACDPLTFGRERDVVAESFASIEPGERWKVLGFILGHRVKPPHHRIEAVFGPSQHQC
ncbi:hypothetical protein [Nesterenkonia alkaliphila]|uniref:Uncharacterized protein n=1 Tax=Nesterenkonia alkaliphila TaxID=1463631 RepID=A0A7K1UJT6_9MICC|nr:hypothetical protein [Nesterenkonia alkaliphila]MVT26664.1 hypothetical protein [Nesterenkonia alkaliphila]